MVKKLLNLKLLVKLYMIVSSLQGRMYVVSPYVVTLWVV